MFGETRGAAPAGGKSDSTMPKTLQTLALNPASPVLFIDNQQPVTQAFVVTALFSDGSSEDLTGKAKFSLGKTNLGSFSAATFTSLTEGGFTKVRAQVDSLVAETILTLVPRRLDSNGVPLDFFFVAPYNDVTTPASALFSFSTKISQADIGFVVDTSGSMQAKINNLSASLSALAGALQAQIPSVAMGVSTYDSWPCAPDGGPADYLWKLDQRVVTVQSQGLLAVQGPLMQLMANNGGDGSEPGFDALYAAASGQAISGCGAGPLVPAFDTMSSAGAVVGETTGTIGGMGFRKGALPLLVIASDAEFHDADDPADLDFAPTRPFAHGHNSTLAAVKSIGGKVIGIASRGGGGEFVSFARSGTPAGNSHEPYDQMYWLAEQTGTVVPAAAFLGVCGVGQCCTGENGSAVSPDAIGNCPLVFEVSADGSHLGTSVASAITKLVTYGGFDDGTNIVGKSTDESGAALPAMVTTANFLESAVDGKRGVSPATSVPGVGSTGGPSGVDANRFLDVKPGTTLQFTVRVYNDFVPGSDEPQFFKATIQVIGDGSTLLDSREVYILVPPGVIQPG